MSDIKLTLRQLAKIGSAVRALNSVRQEIQNKNPDFDVNWYLEDSNNLNLMGDPPGAIDSLQENIIEEFTLNNSGGGGW